MGRAAAPAQGDVFGGTTKARRYHASTTKPNGYAHMPGTGPEGATCGACAHCRFRAFYRGSKKQRRFYKCALMTAVWTSGRETDINVRSPACSSFEAGTPRESGIVR